MGTSCTTCRPPSARTSTPANPARALIGVQSPGPPAPEFGTGSSRGSSCTRDRSGTPAAPTHVTGAPRDRYECRVPALTAPVADRLARAWLEAFNAHRADQVVALFADDVTACSPVIERLRPDSGGRLRGKAAVQAFYEDGLRLVPDLRFTLVQVLSGIDQLTVLYRNQHDTLVAETLRIGGDGLVREVDVTYGPPPPD